MNIQKILAVFAVALGILASLPALAAGEDKPVRDKWAVIIGIDKFKDPSIPQLRYSAKDARDFASFLTREGNFAADHVKVLLNEEATEDNILDTLGGNWLPRRVLPDDLVVIYVSSHGSPKELDLAGENYLIAHDTVKTKLYASGIRLSDLGPGIQERTGCDRVVLLLDACNSGAARAESKGLYRNLNFDLDALTQKAGNGLVVISSSSQDQRSWESKRYENGVFTKNLIDCLRKDKTEKDLKSVFTDLKENVEQEVRFDRKMLQTPVMRSKWEGSPLDLTCLATRPRKAESDQETEPAEIAAPDIVPPKDSPTASKPVASDKLAIIGVMQPAFREARMMRKRKNNDLNDFNLPKTFRDELARRITAETKLTVIENEAVFSNIAQIYQGQRPNFYFPDPKKLSSLGQSLGSRYLLLIQVNQSNLNINMTAKLFEAKNGKQKAVIRKTATRPPKRSGSARETLTNMVIPNLADQIARALATRI